MTQRLVVLASCISILLLAVVAALWAFAYALIGSLPVWAVAILLVASLGCVVEARHMFRRLVMWTIAYQYELTQGLTAQRAKAVAGRYVDARLPWSRPLTRQRFD